MSSSRDELIGFPDLSGVPSCAPIRTEAEDVDGHCLDGLMDVLTGIERQLDEMRLELGALRIAMQKLTQERQ